MEPHPFLNVKYWLMIMTLNKSWNIPFKLMSDEFGAITFNSMATNPLEGGKQAQSQYNDYDPFVGTTYGSTI